MSKPTKEHIQLAFRAMHTQAKIDADMVIKIFGSRSKKGKEFIKEILYPFNQK